jgi:hypothetical protein
MCVTSSMGGYNLSSLSLRNVSQSTRSDLPRLWQSYVITRRDRVIQKSLEVISTIYFHKNTDLKNSSCNPRVGNINKDAFFQSVINTIRT